MTYQEKHEELINRFIERKRLSIGEIQRKGKASFKLASAVYREWKNYHDELYWHNAIYEISFMEEPPTVVRIMSEFNISMYFATKLFIYYMELVNDR